MSESEPSPDQASSGFSERVEISGHIIDSLLLPKILDEITAAGGDYEIREIRVGHSRHDPSYARLHVRADSDELLEEILLAIGQHGAAPVDPEDCRLVPADMTGAFPEGFYCSTNEDTEIRLAGEWTPVTLQEMDCGVVYDPATKTARCVPMADVREGELVVIGRQGTRVHPVEPDKQEHNAFSFLIHGLAVWGRTITVVMFCRSFKRSLRGLFLACP